MNGGGPARTALVGTAAARFAAHGPAAHPTVLAGIAVERRLRERRAAGRKLLVPYLTGGVTGDWTAYLRAFVDAGADAIEIGLPFSDPMLDGPTIQAASDQAIARGATVGTILDEVAGLAAAGGGFPVPLIAMTYCNLIPDRRPESFCAALAAAGIRGLVVPDLPLDEAAELEQAAAGAGVELVLLAAPATEPERLARIAARSRGFVYAVSLMGTTGERVEVARTAARLGTALRAVTDRPVLLGFGISTPEHAVDAARYADGVVVASALMRAVLDGAGPSEVAGQVAAMRRALDAAFPTT